MTTSFKLAVFDILRSVFLEKSNGASMMSDIDTLRYLHSLSRRINERLGKDIVVMSIAGAGCIGKTTLATQFLECVGDSECQIIGLDGYMLGRKRATGITGYNPRRFELAKARSQLSRLIFSGEGFILHHYNRQTHERDIPKYIVPREIIIIEGGLALREEIHDLADVHVFLDSDKETQYLLRLRRERREFNYSPQQVRDRFEKYHCDYLKFIRPQLQYADIVFRVDKGYNVTLVKDCLAMR